jgi:uncharacterized low-complexity protein
MSDKNIIIKPVAAAVGVAFVSSLAFSTTALAADNPFAADDLDSGYMLAGGHEGEEGNCGGNKGEEGKCGEGKCGGDDKGAHSHEGEEGMCGEGKCGEGKCGGDDKGAHTHAQAGEGKCGEGKCGEDKGEADAG